MHTRVLLVEATGGGWRGDCVDALFSISKSFSGSLDCGLVRVVSKYPHLLKSKATNSDVEMFCVILLEGQQFLKQCSSLIHKRHVQIGMAWKSETSTSNIDFVQRPFKLDSRRMKSVSKV